MNIQATCFPPIIGSAAKTLILGSIPGAESLRVNRYYANPHNAFWRIISQVLGVSEDIAYAEKTAALTANGIALWDVINSCERPGSLDSNIKQKTIVANDFVSLFDEFVSIEKILFNGAKAETEFMRRVLPDLPIGAQEIRRVRLPSTSPAMASLSFEEKLDIWSKEIEIFQL